MVGGVGYRWLRDASFGLLVTDALAGDVWPDTVEIADLGYGALYVALDLLDRKPPVDRLVLVAATVRGRAPGTLSCTRWEAPLLDAEDVQARVREAGAGVIDLDHLLTIGHHFGALPSDVVCIELEPADTTGGDGLSERVAEQLPRACELARRLALAERDARVGRAPEAVAHRSRGSI